MNKQDFLQQLQTRIRVLAASEQQDILDEYAQHIDLQICKGASEEAATGDFGSLDQLAAEILEAYHVNPTFAEPPKTPAGVKLIHLSDLRPALKRGWGKIAASVRWLFRGFARFFGAIGSGLGRFFHSCAEQAKAVPEQVWGTKRAKKEKKETADMKQTTPLHTVGSAVRKTGRGLTRFLRALLRLTWNLAMVLLSLPFALVGIVTLLCSGTLMVLLTQGYPLAGPLLCCVGAVLCAVALVVLLGSLVRKGHSAAALPAAPEAGESPLAPLAEVEAMEVYHD